MGFLDMAAKNQKETEKESDKCKAFKNGHCISPRTGEDTGPCSFRPTDWRNCAVVDECIKFYGKW